MAKIRKIYSSVWEKWAKNSQKTAKNSQKIENKNFTAEIFFAIFLKTKKLVPMAKIRKNYSSVWEKWAKNSIFGQKWPKNRKREFSRGNVFRHFLKDQKIGSYGKTQENLYYRLGEMGQKEHFWPKTAKKIENKIFAKNPKRHKSMFYGCPASRKKNGKKSERGFSCRTGTNARTDARE